MHYSRPFRVADRSSWTTISRYRRVGTYVTHETTPQIGHLGQQRLRDSPFFPRSVRPRPRFALYQNAICIVRAYTGSDLWHAIAAYTARSTGDRGCIEVRRTARATGGWYYVIANFPRASKSGRKRAREAKEERNIYVDWRKKTSGKFVRAFSEQSATFDADCLITEPPLRPMFREMQFIVSLCRRACLRNAEWHLMHFIDVIDSISVAMHLPLRQDFQDCTSVVIIARFLF